MAENLSLFPEPSDDRPSRHVDSRSLAAYLDEVKEVVKDGLSRAWVVVEVAEVRTSGGHLYLELVESDEVGRVTAKVRGIVWRNQRKVVDRFVEATGVELDEGLSLLVLARPVFHQIYGLSLTVEKIDPTYTWGQMSGQVREILARLDEEGVADKNRRLSLPFVWEKVAVISPPEAAGLGDFREAVADLDEAGLCRFDYFTAPFQGTAVANLLPQKLSEVEWLSEEEDRPYDGVVLIRGGGATTDLHHLNQYRLARAVCQCPLPVMVGVGHERDRTVLDEVAARSYPTPSLVGTAVRRAVFERWAELARQWHEVDSQVRDEVARAGRELDDRWGVVHRTVAGEVERRSRQVEGLRRETVPLARAYVSEVERRLERSMQQIEMAVVEGRERAARRRLVMVVIALAAAVVGLVVGMIWGG